MRTPSANLLSAYQQGTALKASLSLTAEWNMNRFYDSVVTASDSGSPLDWDTYWPKDSVVSPNRPSKGIVRARLSSGKSNLPGTSGAKTAGVRTSPDFVDSKPSVRYYILSNDDFYRYWSSYLVTTGSANAQGVHYFSTPQSIQVTYSQSVKTNKIVIGLETSEALPKSYEVAITNDGVNWVTIAQSPPVDSDGRIIIWYSDAWIPGNNMPFNFTNASEQTIKGVKFIAQGMDALGAPLSVIELSARYQQDLSEYVSDERSDFELADSSTIAPLGNASSNKASVTLNNPNELFYNESLTSPYRGLIDKNVKMWCDYIINGEKFRQWTMYTSEWGSQISEEVSVDLYDQAEFLQNIKTPAVFWQGLTAGSILWRLLDQAGISDWNYQSSSDDVSEIPFYWNDPDKTVWENISDISNATQTAIWFDEYNVAQIQSAKRLYDRTLPAKWTFSSETYNGAFSDIIQMNNAGEIEANQVEIKYKNTKFPVVPSTGLPKMEVVWEPEGSLEKTQSGTTQSDTLVLRAAPIIYDLSLTSGAFFMSVSESATWPLEGLVNIEGEIISYNGKTYRWYKNQQDAVYSSKFIYSEDERKKLDEETPEGNRWRNGYDGGFKITGRGLMGTTPKIHSVNSKYTYTNEFIKEGNTLTNHWSGGFTKNPDTSTVTLKGRSDFDWSNLYVLRTTDTVPVANYRYGTRIRFPSKGQPVSKGAGGLYIKGSSYSSGFFIDLAPTELVEATARATRDELRFIVRRRDGSIQRTFADLSGSATKSEAIQINRDTWYDLEATAEDRGNNKMLVNIYIDGVLRASPIVQGADIVDWKGHFGTFIRDNCIVDFDYLYAVGSEDYINSDQASFYDNIKGGYVGTFFDKVIPYQNITPGIISRGTRGVREQGSIANQTWLDEFGPVAHEIRRFDVDFEKKPVASSYLYFSNEEQVACPIYLSDAYGASFYLANTYRRNVVVNGDDSLTYGADNSVDQKIFVYGRAFSDEDQQTEIVKNEVAIRKRGLNTVTFESDFIQSEDAAKQLGAWIIAHASNGVEEYSLELFGNPFVTVGDIVSVNYPVKNITPASKFCVTSVNNQIREGITTSLTIHRL